MGVSKPQLQKPRCLSKEEAAAAKPPTIFIYGDLLHPHGESDSQMVFILLTGSISSYITIGRTLGNKLLKESIQSL